MPPDSCDLLSQLVAQRARLQQHSDKALDLGDIRSAVACENAITGNLTLVAKLLGQLVMRHEVRRTSILVSADYLQVRGAIMSALAPHPEAARAVGVALHALEVEAADEIKAAARKMANGSVPPLIEAKTVEVEEATDGGLQALQLGRIARRNERVLERPAQAGRIYWQHTMAKGLN